MPKAFQSQATLSRTCKKEGITHGINFPVGRVSLGSGSMTVNRLSAHIGYLFTELPLEERVAAAAAAGFTAIEHPQPLRNPTEADEGSCWPTTTSSSPSQLPQPVMPARGKRGFRRLRDGTWISEPPFDKSLDYARWRRLVHPMAGVPEVSATEMWWTFTCPTSPMRWSRPQRLRPGFNRGNRSCRSSRLRRFTT